MGTGEMKSQPSPSAAKERHQVFYVHDFSGTIASTRPKGREVAAHIARVSEGAPLIEINFSGVEVASAPFMQEVVRAVSELRDRAIYSCLNEDVHAVLTFVENHHAR